MADRTRMFDPHFFLTEPLTEEEPEGVFFREDLK